MTCLTTAHPLAPALHQARQRLLVLWTSLTAPPPGVSASERRRRRLLSSLLLTLVILVGVSLLLFLAVFSRSSTALDLRYTLLIVSVGSIIVLAYAVNRAGHYVASARLTLAGGILGPWGSLAVDPSIAHGDVMPLVWAVIPVLLCSILLSARLTISMGVLQCGALLLLHVRSPAMDSIDWPSLLLFMLFISGLSAVANVVSRGDLQEIDQKTDQLHTSHAQLQAILDNTNALIYLKDLLGRYLLINRAFEIVFHVHRAQVVGQTATAVFPPDLVAALGDSEQHILQAPAPHEQEESFVLEGGTRTYLTVRFALCDAQGQPYALCGISTDITARKRAEEDLRQQSVRDGLTGLFNRRYLEETLERELQRANRGHRELGVIMLDIDHFKRINDTAGHAAGDTVLRILGDFLDHSLRASDIACRYGGEEFLLILPDISLEAALARAERVRAEVERLPVQQDGQPLAPITLSLGVAIFPTHGVTVAALLAAADFALYRAKREGRDRVVLADTPPSPTPPPSG